ncbi:hypothetical protein GCM10025876_19570 [Demequina litorisediminis]|uniref:Uncharacterized protein n=1 Tax=Demequina litorisediminis TaxID=1849022 RepID=A0ABQ6ID24_9MICO|nr:hypothetical protein GCM10025876_19570 [Demequina litorisediminis]
MADTQRVAAESAVVNVSESLRAKDGGVVRLRREFRGQHADRTSLGDALDAVVQHAEQGEEDGRLDQHREARRERVRLVLGVGSIVSRLMASRDA